MNRKITAIAAIGNHFELGKNNDLLWHLPKDFKRFKALTTNHFIVMGRKTFESFPKPLPHRTHVVITSQANYKTEHQIILADSVENALKSCPENQDIFIIGGGEIYKQALPYCNALELTHVNGNFEEAEVYFPEFNLDDWHVTFECYQPKDSQHAFDFWYKTYRRK